MDAQTPHNKSDPIEAFIARWQGQEGGQERANYALFLTELCDVLGLPHPDVAKATHAHNDYVFERAVQRHLADGDSAGRIDLYKRNSFVLEAKQSRWKGEYKEISGQNDLFSAEDDPADRSRRGTPPEPILRKFKNIEVNNAVLTWDGYPTPQVNDRKETYPNSHRRGRDRHVS
jgi:hypothetical protein